MQQLVIPTLERSYWFLQNKSVIWYEQKRVTLMIISVRCDIGVFIKVLLHDMYIAQCHCLR